MSDLIQLCYVGNLIDDDEEISIFSFDNFLIIS